CTWTDRTSVFLGARKKSSTSGGGWFPSVSELLQARERNVPRAPTRQLTAYLSRNSRVNIIQAYAPTANSDEEQHDNFHDQAEELVLRQRGYVVVKGDLNARVGSRKHGEVFIGPHSAEERSEPGERLASFCELHHLYHGDSQFFKAPRKRWTLISPNGQHCHEFDHILCNRKIMTDVAVVPSFNRGSDHRLL
ncbi:hypothetical protein V3C99_016328, partial [Haemonchus contortus]